MEITCTAIGRVHTRYLCKGTRAARSLYHHNPLCISTAEVKAVDEHPFWTVSRIAAVRTGSVITILRLGVPIGPCGVEDGGKSNWEEAFLF